MQYDNSPIEYEEETAACEWCGEEYPLSELREEKDLGYLCEHCIQAIWSHGEKLYLEY